MTDDLVKIARNWDENGPPQPPFHATGLLIEAMADRIEELEDKLKIERALTDGAHRRAKAAEAKLAKAVKALEEIRQAAQETATKERRSVLRLPHAIRLLALVYRTSNKALVELGDGIACRKCKELGENDDG